MKPARNPEIASPALRDRWQEYQTTGHRAATIAGDLSAAQLWWRPAEDRWSIGECLDHLVLAGKAYLDVIDEAIENGRKAGLEASGPPRSSRFGQWLVRGVEPPPRLKIKAPKRIRPHRPDAGAAGATVRSANDPLYRFVALRDRFARRLAAADGLDLGRVRVRSPFVPLIRVDLTTAFRIVAGHERRHLWQARRVRQHDAFPVVRA
jgi:hypothetical protein